MTTRAGDRRRLTAAVAAALALGLLLAPPAAAHDSLVSTDPAADAVLTTAPTEVSLTFTGDLLDVGATVMVVDAAGTDHAAPATVDGSRIAAPVDDLPDGSYTVRWRVVSSDGHPISGVVPFVVGNPSTTTAAPPAPGPTTAPSSDAPAAAAGGSTGTGIGRTLAVGGLGAVTGVLALVILRTLTSLRRRTVGASHDTESS